MYPESCYIPNNVPKFWLHNQTCIFFDVFANILGPRAYFLKRILYWKCVLKPVILSTMNPIKGMILARAVGVPVGWRLGGQLATMLVATINNIFFLLLVFSVVYFSWMLGVLGSKNLFSKSWRERPKPGAGHLSRSRRPFWGPQKAILDFAEGVVFQTVSECPQRR